MNNLLAKSFLASFFISTVPNTFASRDFRKTCNQRNFLPSFVPSVLAQETFWKVCKNLAKSFAGFLFPFIPNMFAQGPSENLQPNFSVFLLSRAYLLKGLRKIFTRLLIPFFPSTFAQGCSEITSAFVLACTFARFLLSLFPEHVRSRVFGKFSLH